VPKPASTAKRVSQRVGARLSQLATCERQVAGTGIEAQSDHRRDLLTAQSGFVADVRRIPAG
jgi:hypothetical protein